MSEKSEDGPLQTDPTGDHDRTSGGRLIKARWPRLRAGNQSLIRVIRSRVQRFPAGAADLSRRIVDHTRYLLRTSPAVALAAAIAGRTSRPSPVWSRTPEFVWHNQSPEPYAEIPEYLPFSGLPAENMSNRPVDTGREAVTTWRDTVKPDKSSVPVPRRVIPAEHPRTLSDTEADINRPPKVRPEPGRFDSEDRRTITEPDNPAEPPRRRIVRSAVEEPKPALKPEVPVSPETVTPDISDGSHRLPPVSETEMEPADTAGAGPAPTKTPDIVPAESTPVENVNAEESKKEPAGEPSAVPGVKPGIEPGYLAETAKTRELKPLSPKIKLPEPATLNKPVSISKTAGDIISRMRTAKPGPERPISPVKPVSTTGAELTPMYNPPEIQGKNLPVAGPQYARSPEQSGPGADLADPGDAGVFLPSAGYEADDYPVYRPESNIIDLPEASIREETGPGPVPDRKQTGRSEPLNESVAPPLTGYQPVTAAPAEIVSRRSGESDRESQPESQVRTRPPDRIPAPEMPLVPYQPVTGRLDVPGTAGISRKKTGVNDPNITLSPGPELTAVDGLGVPPVIQARARRDEDQVPTSELSLPSESQTEGAATPADAGTGTTTAAVSEEAANGAAAPDIDAIARDVYRILKRRLSRERERTLGLS